MAEVGASIENSLSGERITWIETAASSAGELLAFDLSLSPGARVAVAHRHVRQEERFIVRSGLIAVVVGAQHRDAAPGETLTIPVGAGHRWWNAGEGEASLRVELRPALDTETFFETFFGLARDGHCKRRGMPSALQVALLLRELGDSSPRAVGIPLAVQNALATGLAPLAKRVRLRAVYPEYSPRHASLNT